MSQHVVPHAAKTVETAWLTSGQVVLRGVQVGLLGGVLLGGFDATRLLLHDPRGQKLLAGALVLTAILLGAHVLACVVLNRLVPPGDEARQTRRRVLTWALEVALFPMSYLPLALALFIGPPVIRVIEALTQP